MKKRRERKRNIYRMNEKVGVVEKRGSGQKKREN